MKIDAVVFDLDGVIVNTVPYYYKSTKKVADEMGVPFSEEDNLAYQGRPRQDLINALASRSNRSYTYQEKIDLGERKNRYYQEYISSLSEKNIMPGILPFLEEVKQSDIPITLASSSSNARMVLKKLGLTDYFSVIMNPKELIKGKPDPEIFLSAADQLGASYNNCVAIEDGEAGLEAIFSTSMFSVGVGTASFLKQADWHIESTRELSLDTLQKKLDSKKGK
ncbi:beta-phosphoglucomutase [Pontibacillus yanchengensis]|uniref:Beta-phosphoglucomutase n=2 Tax=Pontibacillus yanchengensis TaxID=462910 RepID=A0ACC7VDW5_9BACI|nr:beta-phosphoglucomutase [Pontibacillus yanchengensis]MYL35355.1 beta-phosphoglucomutase [Pontibacillus yanchengensis]MYL52384.1 beta-phosphoglucomutase [Pontibacillus yanchengensis]